MDRHKRIYIQFELFFLIEEKEIKKFSSYITLPHHIPADTREVRVRELLVGFFSNICADKRGVLYCGCVTCGYIYLCLYFTLLSLSFSSSSWVGEWKEVKEKI